MDTKVILFREGVLHDGMCGVLFMNKGIDEELQQVKPGDMCVVFANNGTSGETYVGVVIDDRHDLMLKILVLGSFQVKKLKRGNNISRSQTCTFPTCRLFDRDRVVRYGFDAEFALWMDCSCPAWPRAFHQNSISSFNSAVYLSVLQCRAALVSVCMVRHILNGGTIDTFVSADRLAELDFFRCWVMLYSKFPERVCKPPNHWSDTENSPVCYEVIINGDGSARIDLCFRNNLDQKTTVLVPCLDS